MSFSHKPVLAFVVSVIGIFLHVNCRKVKEVPVLIEAAESCFITLIQSADTKKFDVQSVSNPIDSVFYFKNCTDSSFNISFEWNFGDGTTSTENSPTHKYAVKGQYAVQLISITDGIAYDTAQATITVTLGPQNIHVEGSDAAAMAIIHAGENEYIILGTSRDENVSNYFLMNVDENFSTKSFKTFSSSKFLSLSSCRDGNIILLGNTESSDYLAAANELIKMSPEGKIIWIKKMNSGASYQFVQQTNDNGFILCGKKYFSDAPGRSGFKTYLTKTDDLGNVQWEKAFDQINNDLSGSANLTLEPDGFTLAGIQYSASAACRCDSVAIIKIDNQGNVDWRNILPLGAAITSPAIRIVRMKNGNYNIVGYPLGGVYTFSSMGEFIDKKSIVTFTFNTVTAEGEQILLTGPGNTRVYAMSQDGIFLWERSFSTGYENHAPYALPLPNGGCIIVLNKFGIANNTPYPGITLVKIDENGNIM